MQDVPPRIAFVHIPKTAGRSVVHAFEQALGADQCLAFSPAITAASFAGKRFVSGHVQLSQVTPDAFAFTFLREPVAQLASHVRWLDRYNLDAFYEETASFSPSLLAAIRRVGQTDFNSAASLGALFEWLPEHSHARLVNVQCEVLAAHAGLIWYADPADMAAAAIANLSRLGFIGFAEQMHRGLKLLFRRLRLRGPPVVTRQNTLSSARRIDLTNQAVHDVLARQVRGDLLLYAYARRHRPGGWRERLF